ncbi:MAG: Uma2 family endonuclease [Bacteroidota bacterium]
MEALLTPTRRYTKEDYFKLLAESEHKYEYLDGAVRMMAGGTIAHSTIVDNANFALRSGQGECKVKSSETAVYVAAANKYFFPDASAVCLEAPKYESRKGIARLTNPCLIVEVLSENTADYDRGDKFRAYRQLASFKEYILIDSRKYSVDTYYREDECLWYIRSYFQPDHVLEVRSLGLQIPLTELYAEVDFAEVELGQS